MSLQIVEKSGEGLSKVFGVRVSAADLAEKMEAKIAEIAPQMNIKGFRPGKVPPGHVRRLYGKSIMGEIIEETLNESTEKALVDAKLRPAGQPDLKLESDMDKVLEGKEDLAYEISVELIPAFDPVDVTKLELKKPVYEPTDAEVDEAITEIAAGNRTYEPRTGKSPKAKDGDMIVMDFAGRVDGELFEGGSAQDAEIVLGSGRFIPGFEDQLKGAKPGDAVTVKVTFPEDYQAARLAGKPAEFEVAVKEVKAPVDAPADDSLAERLGLSSLDALKDAIRKQLAGRYEAMSRFKLKRALLDELDSKHDFPLPPRMVEAEFEGIWQQVQAENKRSGPDEDDAGKSEEQLREEYRKIAERRVRLGLVLAEIGQREGVTISDQEVMAAARQEALRYTGQEQQVFEMFRTSPQAQAQLRAPLYEDKVVDAIVEKAKVSDQKVSRDEILKEDEMPEGYGA
jgi:trigger factor